MPATFPRHHLNAGDERTNSIDRFSAIIVIRMLFGRVRAGYLSRWSASCVQSPDDLSRRCDGHAVFRGRMEIPDIVRHDGLRLSVQRGLKHHLVGDDGQYGRVRNEISTPSATVASTLINAATSSKPPRRPRHRSRRFASVCSTTCSCGASARARSGTTFVTSGVSPRSSAARPTPRRRRIFPLPA